MGDILRGRDDDLSNLANKARGFNILEITAASGVGKSSFIAAGLVPKLQAAGAHIVPGGEDWSWSSVLARYDAAARDAFEPELLYRCCLGWPAPQQDASIDDRFDELRQYGRPVVVLDQFEELVRYRERLGAELLEFIGRTASEQRITHIVAARSEYRDRFRPMENASGSFFHWALPEIDREELVDEIITAPVDAAGLHIEKEATTRLREWWRKARDQPASELMGSIVGRADVGLLHLQGVLWLFKNWLRSHVPGDTSTITLQHVLDFAAEYVGSSDDASAPRLYHIALVEYVRECCDSLHSADTDVAQWMDARASGRIQWVNGPRLMMAKSAHLFSVLGYKVAQSRSGMFQTVLSEDMEPAAARSVAASAAASRSEAWLSETAAKHGHEGIKGRGFAINWSGEQVLAELLGAATQAWAAASGRRANILRRFVQSDEDVYELVHDGMGHALREWAREELLKPRSVLGVITQRAGKSLHLPLGPGTFLEPGVGERGSSRTPAAPHWDGFASFDDRGIVTVTGLGWDASLVTSSISDAVLDGWTLTGALFTNFEKRSEIRDVVFRGCDFAGAAFRNVLMINVRFEQCNLHGASLSDCMLDGVDFVQAGANRDISGSASLNLFSFVRCAARGRGVTLRSLRDTTGLLFDRIQGGPWLIEGTGVRHVAVDADDMAVQLTVGPGTYSHLTVTPAGLVVEVDPAAQVTASEIVVADRKRS
jgi:hypothetical protein